MLEYADELENVLCSKSDIICDKFNTVGFIDNEFIEYESKCVTEGQQTCISLKKIYSLEIEKEFCLVTNEEDEKYCLMDQEILYVDDLPLSEEDISTTYYVYTPIDTILCLAETKIRIVGVGGQFHLKVQFKRDIQFLELENVVIELAEMRRMDLISLELYNATISNINELKATRVSLYNDSPLTIELDNISLIELYNYQVQNIDIYDDYIVLCQKVFNITKNTIMISVIGKNSIRTTINIYGDGINYLTLVNTNKKSRANIFIHKQIVSKFLTMTWSGSVIYPQAQEFIPIKFSMESGLWLIMTDADTYYEHVTIKDEWSITAESTSINFNSLELMEKGKINRLEDNILIHTRKLILHSTIRDIGSINTNEIYVDDGTFTCMSLYQVNDPLTFYVNYSYSSVPYLELKINDGQRGNIYLNNIDDFNAILSTEEVPVDFLCAENLDCSKWSVIFESNNPLYNSTSSVFGFECRKGTFDPSLKCLSIVPKIGLNNNIMSGYVLTIVVALSSCISAVILCFCVFYIIAKAKRHFEHSKLIKMSLIHSEDEVNDLVE